MSNELVVEGEDAAPMSEVCSRTQMDAIEELQEEEEQEWAAPAGGQPPGGALLKRRPLSVTVMERSEDLGRFSQQTWTFSDEVPTSTYAHCKESHARPNVRPSV